jgi:hypothetical protein
MSAIAVTAVAATAIGGVGASAATTSASAMNNLAVAGRAGSTFPAGHTTPVLAAVFATQQHTQAAASQTAQPLESSDSHSDSRETSTDQATATPAATAAHPAAATTPAAGPTATQSAPAHAASATATPTPSASATAAQATSAHAAHARHAKAAAAPPKPYLFYDSVTPAAIPAGQLVATYANGSYAASPSDVAGRGQVLWIDTNGADPQADALDVEPGDATPAGAAAWVQARLTADPKAVAIVYTMISEWQSVRDNVATLPAWMQAKVRYWIADPTGVAHVLPGADATQWYWGKNYDISTANPGFQG